MLVCNGKHQNQAREDLEAFLGDESRAFVAWYQILTCPFLIISDSCSFEWLDPFSSLYLSVFS